MAIMVWIHKYLFNVIIGSREYKLAQSPETNTSQVLNNIANY